MSLEVVGLLLFGSGLLTFGAVIGRKLGYRQGYKAGFAVGKRAKRLDVLKGECPRVGLDIHV